MFRKKIVSRSTVYVVLVMINATMNLPGCSSTSKWVKISQTEKREEVDQEYRLIQTMNPSRNNFEISLELEQKKRFKTYEVNKERRINRKEHPRWTLVSLGSGLVGLSIVDMAKRGSQASEYSASALVFGGIVIYAGFYDEWRKISIDSTNQYRSKSNYLGSMSGNWQPSNYSGDVYIKSPTLNEILHKQLVNGRFRIDLIADLNIGANAPVPDSPINVQIWSNSLELNQSFTFKPADFLQPYLEITVAQDNIRSGPGVQYKVVQKCQKGDLYSVVEERGNWIKLEATTQFAWTHKNNGRIVYTQPFRLDKAGPLNLTASAAFIEPSGNNKLDAEETAELVVSVKNTGKSLAYRVSVMPEAITMMHHVQFGATKTITRIPPAESRQVSFQLRAGLSVPTETCKLKIEFSEHNSFQPDPIFVTFDTKAFEPPNIKVVDVGIDDASANGQIEQGEITKITARVQNVGYGIAKAVRVRVVLGQNVYLAENSQRTNDLGELAYNDYSDVSFSIYTNNRITGEIPIKLLVTESRQKYGTAKDLGLAVNSRQRVASKFVFKGEEEIRGELKSVAGLSIDIEKDIPQSSEENPDAVALIIGIADYQNPGIPKVQFANRDAHWMRKYAEKVLGINPRRILPRNPDEVMTAGQLKTHVRQILPALMYENESDVFFYYSGHGAPNTNTQEAFLVPADCDPNFVNNDNAYRLEDLYYDLSQLKAKNLTVVLDACFSGYSGDGEMLIRQASPILIKVKNPLLRHSNAILFSSAKSDQISNWYPQMKHSMFTYFFLKGLKGEADKNGNREITVGEMEKFLLDGRQGVPYYANAEFFRKQVPQVLGDRERILVKF